MGRHQMARIRRSIDFLLQTKFAQGQNMGPWEYGVIAQHHIKDLFAHELLLKTLSGITMENIKIVVIS